MDDFVVMLRLTPKITIFYYIERLLYLTIFLLYSFVVLVELLYVLLNVPFSALLRFMLHNGWFVIESAFGIPAPPAQQNGVTYFWLLVLMFASVIWILFQTKRAIRDFRGLIRLHRMTPQERSKFALKEFLNISLPIWLSPSVSYEPTAKELLDVLREREQATEGQTQAIASTLADEADEDEESPSVSWLLTLTNCIELSIIDLRGKKVTVKFTSALASLLGFLATRPPEEWTLTSELYMQVYGARTGKGSVFRMQHLRIIDQIIKELQQAEMLPGIEANLLAQNNGQGTVVSSDEEDEPGVTDQTSMENTDVSPHEEEERSVDDTPTDSLKALRKALDLFEQQVQGQRSLWRIAPKCTVEVFPGLRALYAKVMRAQALPEDPSLLSLEELRQGYHRLIVEYGNVRDGLGFLAMHMTKGYVWSWALSLYQEYREQCLAILSYATERERAYLDILKTRGEKYDVVESIAQLYGWRALVATGLDLKHKGIPSEEDMMRCLSYYEQIRKYSAARAIYQSYCELRHQIEPDYTPSEALQKRAEKVISSAKKASQPRQTMSEEA
jgi:hypothetical protein